MHYSVNSYHMSYLHFCELVANSFEFVQSHSYVLVHFAYAPLIVRLRVGPSCLLFISYV